MRRRLLKLVLLVLALALIPVSFLLYQWWFEARQLEDVVTRLDRVEPNWRLEDLIKKPPLADERNSAGIIRKAVPRGANGPGDVSIRGFNLQPNQALTPLQAAKVREAVDKMEPNLLDLRKLADFPEGRFAVKFSKDFVSTLVPHVQDVREVGTGLALDAAWQAHLGNFDQAVTDLHAARNASHSLRDDTFLISLLVRYAILYEVVETLERMLAQGQLAAPLLEKAQELLTDELTGKEWFDVIKGERAGLHELFVHIEQGAVPRASLQATIGVARTSFRDRFTELFPTLSVRRSHIWLLEYFNKQLAAEALSWKERRDRIIALDESAEEAPPLARLLLGAPWRRTYDASLRVTIKLDAARTGIAAERFRLDERRWPKTLEELVPKYLPQMPVDPHDGSTLRLRLTKDGIVIYSPGPNGEFKGEGRDAVPPEGGWQDHRLGYEFRVWNPRERRKPGRDL